MKLTYVFVAKPDPDRQDALSRHRQAVQTWLTSLRTGNVSESIAAFSALKDDFRFAKSYTENGAGSNQHLFNQNRLFRICSKSLFEISEN